LHIFSDKFLGVPSGWHKILEGNFLVGENSTGKSSFGKLVQIIWSHEFSMNFLPDELASNTNDIRDFWSKLSGNIGVNSSFTIGYFRESSAKRERFAKLITYSHDNLELYVKKVSVLEGDQIFKVFYASDNLVRTAVKLEADKVSTAKKLFLEAHLKPQRNRQIQFRKTGTNRVPGPLIASLLYHPIDKASDDSYSFKSPLIRGRGNVHAFGPVRSKPERIYFVGNDVFDSEGKFAAAKLHSLLSKGKIYNSLKKFGSASGLYDDIKIKDLSRQLGRRAFTVSFEKSGRDFFADELGFGLSQIMPLITDTLNQNKNSLLIIQQPELHLHPKAQAAFGDVLFQFLKHGRRFIVETHSDFIIDRFRVNLSKDKRKKKPSSQVLFFSSAKSKNEVSKIKILNNGSFENPPKKYRQFFLKEQFRVFDAL